MFTLLTSEFGHAKDVLLKVAKSFFSPPSLAFLTLSGCVCGVCRAGHTEDDCVCVCACACVCEQTVGLGGVMLEPPVPSEADEEEDGMADLDPEVTGLIWSQDLLRQGVHVCLQC